jgi:hypothetical protein
MFKKVIILFLIFSFFPVLAVRADLAPPPIYCTESTYRDNPFMCGGSYYTNQEIREMPERGAKNKNSIYPFPKEKSNLRHLNYFSTEQIIWVVAPFVSGFILIIIFLVRIVIFFRTKRKK